METTRPSEPNSPKIDGKPRNEISGMEPGVVEDLISALVRSIPVLDGIRHSLRETSCQIPRASEHLDEVHKTVDEVEGKRREIGDMFGTLDGLVRDLTRKYPADDSVHALAQLHERLAVFHPGPEVRESVCGKLAQMKKLTLGIAVYLQVQDITAQQISEVGGLIESVRSKLIEILQHFDPDKEYDPPRDGDGKQPAEGRHHDAHLFDATESIIHARDRQLAADAIISEWKKLNLK